MHAVLPESISLLADINVLWNVRQAVSKGTSGMNMRLLVVGASVALLSLGYTLAHAQSAKKPSMSVGSRTAACKSDCRAGNLHGTYRAYNTADPNLASPEGRKMFAECVQLCLAPLPAIYVQRRIIEAGGSWFGKTKADCLGCHAQGKPQRSWAGINTLPDNLKRDNASRY